MSGEVLTADLPAAYRVEFGSLPLERLEAEITTLAGHIAAAECRWLLMVAEFDRREGWGRWGCRSCAHWLSWQCGLDERAGYEKVRVARAMSQLPRVCEAFAAGRLSYSKVRAITRVATTATEAELVDMALCATAAQIERLTGAYRRVLEADDRLKDDERHEGRFVRWFWEDDGSFEIRARLSPEDGALVKQAIEEAARHCSAEQRGEVPKRSLNASPPSSQARADALVLMAESFLAHGAASRSSGDRVQVVLHTDEATLRGGSGEHCELEDGPVIGPETARRLACDASVVWMLDGPDGMPVNVSRKTRTIPTAMRRALRARDQGCRFPGCSGRVLIDAHHIKHYADGGATCMANLVQLCWFHHRLVHEGGYGIGLDESGAVMVTRPDGTVLQDARPKVDNRASAIEAGNAEHGIAIDAQTCIPDWAGDRLDLDFAVLGLLESDGRIGRQRPRLTWRCARPKARITRNSW